MPIVSATWDAEAGELLEGGGGCGEPRSRHCTPAWATEQDSFSKKRWKEEFSDSPNLQTVKVQHEGFQLEALSVLGSEAGCDPDG